MPGSSQKSSPPTKPSVRDGQRGSRSSRDRDRKTKNKKKKERKKRKGNKKKTDVRPVRIDRIRRKRPYRLNWMTFNKSRYIVDNFADCLNLRLYRDTLTMVHAHRNTLTYHIAHFNTRTPQHTYTAAHARNGTSKRARVRECLRENVRE